MKHKPLTFANIDEMPEMVVSRATMEWNGTGTWRYIRPSYCNRVPACSHRCPAGNDIEGFLRLIGEGRYTDAWLKLKEENPLTRVCGRVCFHPCETACNRKHFDLAVSVNALERFAGEHADRKRLAGVSREATGKKVAVVGSGPAGLTAAYFLARLGHKVTVFEMRPEPGGILRYGIPEHRLPRAVLSEEVEDVKALGVEFRCGVKVGSQDGVSYAELSSEHDAVFLAIGAHESRSLGVPGEEAPQVLSGLELLRRVAMGEKLDLGARAAVVGGGNTAVDAARVLLRLGVRVDIYYRRSRAEMPAFEEEIEEGVREGVGLHMLVAPTRVQLDDKGNVKGMTLQRMELGAPDSSGRRRPVPIEGSEYLVKVDMIVAAIGEIVDKASLPPDVKAERDGSVIVDEFGAASEQGLWAGGDVTPVDRTVVTAIGAGKWAAVAIDKYLRGASKEEVESVMRVGRGGGVSMSRYLATGQAHASYEDPNHVVDFDELNTAHFQHLERQRVRKLAVAERVPGFAEVNCGLTEEDAKTEAQRCFHCGVCTECDNCWAFCPDVAISRKEKGFGYVIDLDYCKGCGLCVAECPRSCMALTEE